MSCWDWSSNFTRPLTDLKILLRNGDQSTKGIIGQASPMVCTTHRDCSKSCRVAIAHIFRLACSFVMDIVEVEWLHKKVGFISCIPIRWGSCATKKRIPIHTRFVRELRFQAYIEHRRHWLRSKNGHSYAITFRSGIRFVLFCFVSFVVWTFEPANRITNEI